LAAAGRVQCGDFIGAEQPPTPRPQIAQAQWPHAHAPQLQHRVMNRLHHPPHLALASFVNNHAQPLVTALFGEPLDLRRSQRALLAFDLHALAQTA
jgi:hypothetical protein